MPTYEYTALKPGTNEQIGGRVDADTDRDARSRIRAKGEVPISVKAIRAEGVGLEKYFPTIGKRNFSGEVLIFSNQLSTLIRSGITLTDALKVLADQTTNKQFSNILNIVYQGVVEKGDSFANSLKQFPHCFTSLYVSMVRAGETTGTLPSVLDRLATYAKKRAAIEARIRSAMTYPVIMMIVGFAIVSFLLSYVVPKLLPILEQQKEALPLATEILIVTSDTVKQYWPLGLGFICLCILLFKSIRATPKGRFVTDNFLLSAPVFGDLARKGAVSRFCVTLSSLLRSGVKIEEALRIVEEVVQNAVVQKTVKEISEKIKEGASIAGPIQNNKVFPKVVTFMISVGEKAGSEELQEMLDNISEAYDTEIEQSAERLTSLLNPIMLILLAGVVCFILIAIMMPIMNISQF